MVCRPSEPVTARRCLGSRLAWRLLTWALGHAQPCMAGDALRFSDSDVILTRLFFGV